MDNHGDHHNPYKAGKPLTSDDGFFGREDIIEKVQKNLLTKQNNIVVLFGQRRIGKTSILHKLERSLPNPPLLVINFDLLDKARIPITEVLYDIASKCAKKAEIKFDNKVAFLSKPDAFHEVFLPLLYKKLADKRRLVLLFDEFDVLDQTQEKLPDTAAANAFHPYLRKLMAAHPNIYFVFVVGRRMEELGYEFLSTFKSSQNILVFVLEEQDAIALIKRGEKDGTVFDGAAIEEILFVTRGHPYFIQLLCQEIFNRNLPDDEHGKLTITSQMVKDALPHAIQSGASAFLWIWNGLPPAERIIFSAIAENTKAGQILTEEDLTKILREAGIRMLVRELKLAPSMLVEWNMLEKIGDGYRFYFEIIRSWVEKNKQLEKVKEDLEKLSPLADSHFQTASIYYHDNKYDLALQSLLDALKSNPYHLRARLLRGTIFYEQKEFEAAIDEFKQAYKLDEDESHHPLIKAMLDFGEFLESQGWVEDAERVYDEILHDIYENEETAQARKSNLLIKRAESYMSKGDVALAYQTYILAGATKQASKIIVDLREQAIELERSNKLKEAMDIYSTLVALQPETDEWRSRQGGINGWIQFEEAVKSKIEQATGLYKKGDFTTSAKMLDEATKELSVIQSERKLNKPHYLGSQIGDLIQKIKKSEETINFANQEYSSGNLGAAENLLNIALTDNPSNRQVQSLITKTRYIKNGIESAEREYDKGDFASAQKIIEGVIRTEPDNLAARKLHQKINDMTSNFARAESAYKNQDFVVARDNLAKVLKDQPLNPKARKLKANVEKNLNKLQVQNRRLIPTAITVAIVSVIGTLGVVITALLSNPAIAEFFLPQPTSTITSINPNLGTVTPLSTPPTTGQLFDSNRFVPLSLASTQQLNGSLAPVKTAVENLQLTPGYHVLDGIPVEFQYEIFTQNQSSTDAPLILIIPADTQNSLAAYFLIQTDWGYARYNGKQIGEIVINFDNGQTYGYPLVMGENIRDWKRGSAPEAVTTISSPDVVYAWEGTSPGSETGGMDLLKVSIPVEFQLLRITSIEIADTSLQSTGETTAGIRILSATVEIQDTSQGPWEYQIEQVPASSSSLAWLLKANEVLILTGGQLQYQNYACGGGSSQICILVIKATKDSTATIENLISKNNWLGVSTTISPEDAISSVQDEFWISPNCGSGCAYATVAIFADDTLVNSFDIKNPNP